MVYIYIFLLVVLPLAALLYFLRTVRKNGVPPNCQLLVDAWNSTLSQKKSTAERKDQVESDV